MDTAQHLAAVLLFFILPLWLLAGFLDWLCHRAQNIASTSGTPESILHVLLISEGGVAVLAGLFLEINALVLAFMLVCYLAHEATVWIDLRYTAPLRPIPPVEQMIHSYQEVLPLTALLAVVVLHWEQFVSLVTLAGTADWRLMQKAEPLPLPVVAGLLGASLVFAIAPFLEELLRCQRKPT